MFTSITLWFNGISLWLLYSYSAAVMAVSDDRLWLPSSQRQLYPQLIHAALMLEDEGYCHEVMSGQLDESSLSAEEPVFRFVCKDSEGKTYSVRVGAESQRVESRHKRAPKRYFTPSVIASYWERCEQLLQQETQLMHELTWLHSGMPSAQWGQLAVEEGSNKPPKETLLFEVDFNARSMRGDLLKYRAYCRVIASEEPHVEIRPRTATP